MCVIQVVNSVGNTSKQAYNWWERNINFQKITMNNGTKTDKLQYDQAVHQLHKSIDNKINIWCELFSWIHFIWCNIIHPYFLHSFICSKDILSIIITKITSILSAHLHQYLFWIHMATTILINYYSSWI